MATQEQNWWEQDETVEPATAPASQFPGIIRGVPSAAKVAAEARAQAGEYRAQEDQAMQREQLQLSKENAARNAKQDELGTESERTAGFLAGRISEAVKRLAPAAKKNPSAQAPTMGVEAVRGVAGDTAANYFTSAERQQIYAAQRDILDAALTLGTGAAYTKEQLKGYEASYLPQLFDDPETIASKRSALRTLLQQGSRKAGRSAPDIEAAINALDQLPDIVANDEEPEGLTGSVTDDSAVIGPDGGGNPPPPNGGLDPNIYNPEGGQGIIDLAKQGITFGLADEAAGAGGYLGALITGNDPSKAYTRERDAARENVRRARIAHPVVGTLAEFMGGGAGTKIASGVMSVGNMVRQGAGFGALGGFGYGEGDQSLTTAAGGAALGGALGGAFGGVGKLIEGRAARSALAPEQVNVIEAGQRQGIPIRQPDVRPELRGKYAAMESTEYGGKVIAQGRADDVAAISDRASEVAGGTAFKSADTTAMGQTVQKIAQRGQDNVKSAASQMYERVAQSVPDFKAPPTNTSRVIDETIADLRAKSPSGYNDVIGALEGMKSDLAETGLSVASLQAQRETIGGRIGDNMQDRSRADAIFTKVLKVAGQEMQDALRAETPQAAAMLKRADAKWGQYKDLQKEVTSLFLGKRGDATAETAARSLNAATRNNYSALRRFMTMATPDEKADFAATFVQNWGANQRGEFSPAIFAKSMEGVSDRMLSTVLGTKGKEALRDLQAISNAKTDAMSRQAPSGKAMERAANGLKTTLMMLFGFTAGGGAGAAAGFAARPFLAALGEKRAARMLMNPDFTKLLRNAPNTNDPATINRYFSRVAGVLAANDNEALTNAIASAFRKSPGMAAANEETDSRGVPPQQNGM